MEVLSTRSGHQIRAIDEIGCVCIKFDYWGEEKLLHVPYAKYRIPTLLDVGVAVDPDGIPHLELTSIRTGYWYMFDRAIDPKEPVPALTDKDLQVMLAPFKKDNDGTRNTDILLECNSQAAEYCRKFTTCCLSPGFFDLGNMYESSIIWIESDNIDTMDPTSGDYPERMLGMKNPKRRFYNEHSIHMWTSTLVSETTAWAITYDGLFRRSKVMHDFIVIPSRAW